MGRVPFLVFVATAISTGALFVACGGSSSESPWPAEPESPVLGPAGEDGKPSSAPVTADGGADAATNVEP